MNAPSRVAHVSRWRCAWWALALLLCWGTVVAQTDASPNTIQTGPRGGTTQETPATGGFLSEAPTPAPGSERVDLNRAALKVLIALLVVLALTIGLAYLLKRVSFGFRQTGGGTITVLAQVPLGPSQFLSIVDIAGEVLVLGVTDQSVTALSEIQDPTLIQKLRDERTQGSATRQALQKMPTFRQWLQRAQQGRPDERTP